MVYVYVLHPVNNQMGIDGLPEVWTVTRFNHLANKPYQNIVKQYDKRRTDVLAVAYFPEILPVVTKQAGTKKYLEERKQTSAE